MSVDLVASLVNLGSAGAVIIVVVIFLKSIKERDAEWRDFFTAINLNNQGDISDMRQTADHLTKSLDNLLNLYSVHDSRALTILTTVELIKVDIARLARSAQKRD